MGRRSTEPKLNCKNLSWAAAGHANFIRRLAVLNGQPARDLRLGGGPGTHPQPSAGHALGAPAPDLCVPRHEGHSGSTLAEGESVAVGGFRFVQAQMGIVGRPGANS